MDLEKMKKELDQLKNMDWRDPEAVQKKIKGITEQFKGILPTDAELKTAKPEKEPPTYQIWTDGACSHNPGSGGWAALIRIEKNGKKEEQKISGGSANTTNNIMELTAAIKALEKIPPKAKAQLFTDSQYLQKGITEWIKNWKKRGWKKANNQPIANLELWQKIEELTFYRDIEFKWVKGHSQVAENELCDQLARAEIKKL